MDKQTFYEAARPLGIGDTPLIPYEEDFDADIYIKYEAHNASGSVKDRAALAMILDAEEKGMLHPGDTILEATSGNMGIALAYVGVSRGYKVILAMPDTMSPERRTLLQGLGAQLLLTDGKLGMQGAIDKVQQLADAKQGVWLKQFENSANALAHQLSTGEELVQQLPQIDVFVAGVGTGGTLIGTARSLKRQFPNCQIVAVEPASSAVLSTGQKGAHAIQGIGAGFVPAVYDASLVDKIITITDDQAIDMFFNLNKNQGYCCGISSAANIVACIMLAQDENYRGKNIVTVFPDSDDRYLSLLKNHSQI